MNYRIPRGTFDIMPPDSAKWNYVKDVFRRVANSFGYDEITTPIFEMAELFERSSGETSDVVQKEMYRFTDLRGRVFALRPEGTAPVVRAYVENHLDKTAAHNKFYYMGPMFRYDRPQAGRYRQFYQYGIEFIGSNNPYYDAEVIALEQMFLKELGLKDFRLEVNSVGCAKCSQEYDEALKEFFRPNLDKLCGDCQNRFDSNPRRILDCKVPSCGDLRHGAPSQLDYLDDDCKDHFEKTRLYLDQMDVDYVINPSIVRGLDYYSNTAFEFIVDSLGAQNTIAGGGRYNGLIEQVGGRATPAVGFAGGFERLILALESQGIIFPEGLAPDIYVVAMGESGENYAMNLLTSMREACIYVEYNPDKRSFRSQMKAADQSKARYALIIGEEEIKLDKPMLKNLNDGSQENLTINQIIDRVKHS